MIPIFRNAATKGLNKEFQKSWFARIDSMGLELQFLAGHSDQRKHLHSFGLDEFPDYFKYAATTEQMVHIIFHNQRFTNEKRRSRDV